MRKQLDLAMPHHGYAQAVPTSNLAQSNAAFAHRITYKVACHAIPGLERLRLRHLLLLGSAISILQFVQSDIFVPRIVIGAAVWSIVEQSEFSNAARTKKISIHRHADSLTTCTGTTGPARYRLSVDLLTYVSVHLSISMYLYVYLHIYMDA